MAVPVTMTIRIEINGKTIAAIDVTNCRLPDGRPARATDDRGSERVYQFWHSDGDRRQVIHARRDGAIALVAKVLNVLVDSPATEVLRG